MNRTYFRPIRRFAVIGSASLCLSLALTTVPSLAGLPAVPLVGQDLGSTGHGMSASSSYMILARAGRGDGGTAGGDPNGADAGGDPNGADADGDPNGADADGDPNGADADGDPNGADADGDPNGADAGGDPNGADAGGDPDGAGSGGGGGEQTHRRDRRPPRKQKPQPPKIVIKKPVLTPPPVALTVAVPKVMVNNVNGLTRECGALLPQFRIHCLAVKIRRIGRSASAVRAHRPMARQLLRVGKRLNRIAHRNRDYNRRVYRSYRPVRKTVLRQAMVEARRAIREAETLLLRVADPANRRPFRRLSRGIASTKRILR